MGWVTEQVWREGQTDTKSVSWVNLFTICMIAGTLYLLWTTSMQATWIKGMVYSGLVWAVIYGIVRLARLKMTGTRQVMLVLFGIVFTIGMMDRQGQEWMSGITGFQVAPLGLVSNTTGQVLMPVLIVSVFLLAVLFLGILLNTKKRRKGLR